MMDSADISDYFLRIHSAALLIDSVPGLERGGCPDIGMPRDNATRFEIAVKWYQQEIRRLQAIVDDVIRTTDGVQVTPDMLLWSILQRHVMKADGSDCHQQGWYIQPNPIPAKYMNLTSVMGNGYSTKEAAEAAMKDRDE